MSDPVGEVIGTVVSEVSEVTQSCSRCGWLKSQWDAHRHDLGLG